jgi:tRNA-specific 2-thiouridylase
VLEIVPSTNTVVVGDAEDLFSPGLEASRMNWLIDPPAVPTECTAKIRYRHSGAEAVVTATPDGGATVRFAEPQSAVTPGQAVTLYAGTRVLGGGWIERATSLE